VINVRAVYTGLLPPWSHAELDVVYRDALGRGVHDLPRGDPGTRPIGLLTSAIPRLNSLTVVTYAIHVVPLGTGAGGGDLRDQMLNVIDRASAGSLLRCHLALDAELARTDAPLPEDLAGDWRPVIYDAAGAAIAGLERDSELPPAYKLAQDATNWVAEAIDLLDRQQDSRLRPWGRHWPAYWRLPRFPTSLEGEPDA
jgi:hypothetical protein